MADLTEAQSALTVKLAGANPATGVEDNFAEVTTSGALTVDGSATIQPISASSLPLPTGASTSALQTSGNASLTSIDNKTPILGQALMVASTPVTLASNQSRLPQLQDEYVQAGLSALNASATKSCSGSGSAVIQINGTWVGTISFQVTQDFATFLPISAMNISSNLLSQTTTSNGIFRIDCGGYTQIRLIMTSYTSGTANLTFNTSIGAGPTRVFNDSNATLFVDSSFEGPVTPGTVALNSALSGGQFNTALPTLTTGQQVASQVDSRGRALTVNTPIGALTQSYSAAITGLVAPATPTDIFTIIGSATKTIKITRISVTATQTTATQRDILLIKRSAANTGGTSTLPATVPHDSSNAAATAAVRAYTVNPTALGTAIGTLRTRKVFIGTTTGNSDEFIMDFGMRPAQEIVLNGVAQTLAINLNSITSAGNSFDISIEWTES